MSNNYVITISRKFGSGGRLIGQKLATKLGIPFYDKTIIELAAKNTGISEDFIEKSGESISNSFLFNMAYAGSTNYRYTTQADTPINDKVFYAQEEVIKQIAAKVGGGGGGKADMAQAGGRNPEGISEAFKVAEELLA